MYQKQTDRQLASIEPVDTENTVFSLRLVKIISGALILIGLYIANLYSYLLFHFLAEMFSIVIACSIFLLAWNARRFMKNDYLLLLGIAYFFVAGMDAVHTMAYKGMNIFAGYDTNLPTQLWIAARYMESISLLLAPFFLTRRLRVYHTICGYTLAFVLFLAAIFYWHIFPVCFVEGTGLTYFKKGSEYIISFILLGALGFLFQRRELIDKNVFVLLAGSILLTICAELAFTFYVHAYGLSNLMGHYLKIISFYFIYKAIIETGLLKPYDILFRDLKKRERELSLQAEISSNLSEGVYLIRLHDLTIVYTNLSFEKMFGYGPGEMIGKHVSIVNAPAEMTPEETANKIKESLKEKGKWKGEIKNIKKDGSSFWCYSSASLFKHSEHGEVIISVHTDINDRKRAQKKLLTSEEKYRTIMGTLKDAVYICSQDFRIGYMNPAMIIKTGRDVTGHICYQALHSLDEKCSWCVLNSIQNGKTIEYEWTDPDGGRYYKVINSPISYGSGISKLSILHDITQERLNQDALKKSAEQLRALALRHTQMEEAEKKKLALELHDRVGQNLTGVNINLNVIEGLLPPGLGDKIYKRLSDAMALTDKTFEQIRDVMADLRPETLDDYGLVASLGQYCEKFEARYNIITQIIGSEFTPRLESKMEASLFRITQEAMTNVVKHARADMITLTFESNDTIDRMTIADNGVGFDPDALNQPGKSNHWGLTIMQERSTAIGMNFLIESGKDRGTKVIVEMKKQGRDI